MAKIGILISMAPDELQDTILQHADRLKEYKLVKEKMVGLLDARARLKDPNAMDIGYAGEDDWGWDDTESSDFDVAAVGKGDHCYRCGGMGHIANECPTPKGKGKGKEDKVFNAKGIKGKGKGANGKGLDKGKGTPFADTEGSADMMLRGVGRFTPTSFRENYNYLVDRSDNSGISVCGLECDAGAWQTVVRRRQKASKNFMEAPPGLKDDNSFDKLSETYDVGGLEVLMPEKAIGRVGTAEKLRSAGKGKVTIDSGAAESVMPKGMLDREPLVEGEAKRMGVKYVAANGAKMENYGEKKIRFRREGLSGINDMLFQVTNVGKPLASVTRILDKGNTVVFSRKPGGSYIMNNSTGQKIQLTEEKGTFVMDVEYLEPDVDAEGFTRQGK